METLLEFYTTGYLLKVHVIVGVSICWNEIWNGTVECKMEWNDECM